MHKIATLIILAVTLSGCATYNATQLGSLPHEYSYRTPIKNGVVVAAKALDKQECKRYLDRDVLKKGYQPVQLYIDNKSGNTYYFSANRVSLPLASPEEVAAKVHTSTIGRVVGYSAAAIVATPLFIIPAVVDGYKSSDANEELDRDFASKSPRDVLIGPHAHVNMILFVPKESYKENFTVTLIDDETHCPNTLSVVASR